MLSAPVRLTAMTLRGLGPYLHGAWLEIPLDTDTLGLLTVGQTRVAEDSEAVVCLTSNTASKQNHPAQDRKRWQ